MKQNKAIIIVKLITFILINVIIMGCMSTTFSQQESIDSFPIIGRWKITGGGNLTDYSDSLLIISEISGRNFNGYFEWYLLGNEYLGREYIRGSYDPRIKKITMEGYKLENEQRITRGSTTHYLLLGKYEIYLARNGYDLESGNLGGRNSSTWTAKLQ